MTYSDVFIKYYNIILRYSKKILRNKTLAEDATQETFLRLLNHWDEIDMDRADRWLMTVAHNICVDVIRKEDRLVPVPRVTVPDEEDIGAALMKEAKEIVKNFKPKYREIFDLIFVQGYKNKEAAQVLQLPLTTVKRRLNICVEELRKQLK